MDQRLSLSESLADEVPLAGTWSSLDSEKTPLLLFESGSFGSMALARVDPASPTWKKRCGEMSLEGLNWNDGRNPKPKLKEGVIAARGPEERGVCGGPVIYEQESKDFLYDMMNILRWWCKDTMVKN